MSKRFVPLSKNICNNESFFRRYPLTFVILRAKYMKNNMLFIVTLELCSMIIIIGFIYFYYCGEAVFKVMTSAIPVIFLVLQVLCPKKSTIDSNNDIKKTHSIEKRPAQSRRPKKKKKRKK